MNQAQRRVSGKQRFVDPAFDQRLGFDVAFAAHVELGGGALRGRHTRLRVRRGPLRVLYERVPTRRTSLFSTIIFIEPTETSNLSSQSSATIPS